MNTEASSKDFFICGNCNIEMHNDQCFGVVQIDDDYTNAELWCFLCVEKYAFCDSEGIWHPNSAIDKKKSANTELLG